MYQFTKRLYLLQNFLLYRDFASETHWGRPPDPTSPIVQSLSPRPFDLIWCWLLNSAQSSQSTTPIHEPRDGRSSSGRFFVATPDLLSSDTDVTSPENYVSLGASVRNVGNGAGGENGAVMQRSMTKQPDDDRMTEMNHHTAGQFTRVKEVDVTTDQSSAPDPQIQVHSTNHRPQPSARSTFTRDVTDFQEMTMDKDGSRSAAADGRGPRVRANDLTTDHQRDSSPINRLAGLFKNLAKF